MPKIRGPKHGKIITASFDSKDNSKSRFPSLKTTKDLILLSIKGNEYCTGEYLKAIVQQAVAVHQTGVNYTGAQGKATFLIADEIYWHNMEGSPSGEDEHTLKKKAIELGEQYLKSNLSAFLEPLGLTPESFNNNYPCSTMDEKIEIINKLAAQQGKNFEIMRWRTWVAQDNFEKTLEEIMPLYSSVEGLKIAIDKTSADFVSRHSQEGDDPKTSLLRSQHYLTEESPSIMLLGASLGYNFVIYPGSILPPFEATREYFVVENHVARIEKGENIKKECTHNKFCFHVEDPSRYVNWLEVNFKRSEEKISEIKVRPNKNITFFAPKTTPTAITFNGLKDTETKDEQGMELVPQKDVSDIIQGIYLAFQKEYLAKKKSNSNQSSPELTQIFEGITQGVLAADMPMVDKIGLLTSIVDTYVNRNTSEHPVPKHLPIM
ncbi:hypothetical protein [Legionella sp. WA2024007413]